MRTFPVGSDLLLGLSNGKTIYARILSDGTDTIYVQRLLGRLVSVKQLKTKGSVWKKMRDYIKDAGRSFYEMTWEVVPIGIEVNIQKNNIVFWHPLSPELVSLGKWDIPEIGYRICYDSWNR